MKFLVLVLASAFAMPTIVQANDYAAVRNEMSMVKNFVDECIDETVDVVEVRSEKVFSYYTPSTMRLKAKDIIVNELPHSTISEVSFGDDLEDFSDFYDDKVCARLEYEMQSKLMTVGVKATNSGDEMMATFVSRVVKGQDNYLILVNLKWAN